MLRSLATVLLALCCCGLCCCGPASAQDDKSFFTFVWENDRFSNTDRNYTNGLRLSYTKQVEQDSTAGAVARAFLLTTASNSRIIFQGLALGQSIFTPEDITATAPLPDQHPYAGWLYGEYSVIAANACNGHRERQGQNCTRGVETLALQLGIVGPSAHGEFVQNNFHRLIGVNPARGWANQLRDEVGVNFLYDRRFQLKPALPLGPFQVDVVPNYGWAAGNVLTQASAGVTVRLGQNFQNMDLPARVRPSTPGAGIFAGRDFGWYLFAGAEGRAVARDIFLDGNTFRDSLSVDKRTFVADFQIGAVARINDVEVSYTYVTRTEEFATQTSQQRFGSFSVTYRY